MHIPLSVFGILQHNAVSPHQLPSNVKYWLKLHRITAKGYSKWTQLADMLYLIHLYMHSKNYSQPTGAYTNPAIIMASHQNTAHNLN